MLRRCVLIATLLAFSTGALASGAAPELAQNTADLLLPALSLSAQPAALRLVPTRFVADRFFATPVTERGDTLVLLMDTGGGTEWVIKPTLVRLGFTPTFMAFEEGDSIFAGGRFPKFRPDASIPLPIATRDSALLGFGTRALPELEGADGMLGQTWFAGRVWVFDYPRQRVSYYENAPQPHMLGGNTIPMTLRNPPRQNHPRIQIVVDGDTIDVLLDTGATSGISPSGLQILGGGPRYRGSSFVSTRLFDRWRSSHPEWRVAERAELRTSADMIEVPSVRIAEFETGPVWFAKRADGVYDGMMARVMDKPILASLGGQALRTFRLTLDYPNQRVTFER